ncbi:hypothetical protein D3C76_1815280 [compost metagenome]
MKSAFNITPFILSHHGNSTANTLDFTEFIAVTTLAQMEAPDFTIPESDSVEAGTDKES